MKLLTSLPSLPAVLSGVSVLPTPIKSLNPATIFVRNNLVPLLFVIVVFKLRRPTYSTYLSVESKLIQRDEQTHIHTQQTVGRGGMRLWCELPGFCSCDN